MGCELPRVTLLAGKEVNYPQVSGLQALCLSVRPIVLCPRWTAGWRIFISADRDLDLLLEHLISEYGSWPCICGFSPPLALATTSLLSVSGFTYSKHFI